MTQITITERTENSSNLLYIQTALGDLFRSADCSVNFCEKDERVFLKVNCPEYYSDIIKAEVRDKAAEVIVIKYKYDFFKREIVLDGLSETDKEILFASLIAADLDDDKRYAFERFKEFQDVALDGLFNFRLQPLKKKWEDVVSYMPPCFISSQLKDFIGFLLENKKKRVYIDNGNVYDSHYRRLKRSSLLDGESAKLTREVLLSNCGEVEILGAIPKDDEKYIKEYYGDKISFSPIISS